MKRLARLLSALFLALALARAFSLWAADPMLAYANNWDQIRITHAFGLQPQYTRLYPEGAGKVEAERNGDDFWAVAEFHLPTHHQPYRFFAEKYRPHTPAYPSADIAVKAFMLAGMTLMADENGVMDIKVGGAMMLAIWAFFVILFAWVLRFHETGLLIFSAWVLLTADPVNFLFLNTWYAEFPAFVFLTILTGVLLAWYFHAMNRNALLWLGGLALGMLGLNRTQYMFFPIGLCAVILVAMLVGHFMRSKIPDFRFTMRASLCAIGFLLVTLPPVVWFGQQLGELKAAAYANRTDTVFGAILPASKNRALAREKLGLHAGCDQFIGSNWYLTPTAQLAETCPQVFGVSLSKMGLLVASEPPVFERIIRNISKGHKGFIQDYIGQIEDTRFGEIYEVDSFGALTIDPWIRALPPKPVEIAIHLLYLAPVLFAAWLFFKGRRRAARIFFCSDLLMPTCFCRRFSAMVMWSWSAMPYCVSAWAH